MRAFRFKVRGSHAFPLDMLRYDQAYPLGSGSVGKIETSIAHSISGLSREVVEVELRTINQMGPTADRWASFGWNVVPGSVVRETL